MATYLPFLIKVGQSGVYSDSMTYEEPFDTKEAFGLWIQHSPFLIRPKTKTPVVQSWLDEDGDDVYLPPSGVKYEAYSFDCSFVYFENDGMANVRIEQFIQRISGKWLKIYDSYTKMCRKGVYVEEIGEAEKFHRRGQQDIVIFKVKFKCNFPTFNETF